MEPRQFPHRPLAALAASILVASCAHGPRTGEVAAAQEAVVVPADAKPAAEVPAKIPSRDDLTAPRMVRGTGVFVNPKPPAPPAAPGPEEVNLNFEGVDVREIAKVILADYLNESYTVHPAVQGTVTFRTIRAIPKKDLLATLEMLLRQNNASVVREEGIYKILPIAAVRGSVSPQLGGTDRPLPQGFSVLVVPLKFVGAREMAKLLEPFAADNTIRIDETRNLVIMAGSQRELKHLVDTVDLFDVDWMSGYSVGLFPVKSADVKSLVQDIERVFAGGPGGQGNPLAGVVRVIPMERLNALFIVTTQPKYLEMARTWLDRFDAVGGTSGGSKFYVYQVRNGKAENLAQLVGDLFSSRRTTTSAPTLAPGQRPTEIRSAPFGQTPAPGQTTTTSVTPGPSVAFSMPGAGGGTTGEVRVIADKDTNSLLILASPGDYDVVENAIKKLDVARRQVLVEVLLAEVTLSDSLEFGLDWYIRTRWRGQTTTGTLTPNNALPTTVTNGIVAPTGVVPAFGSGLQLINLSGDQIRAVLRALGEDNKAQVVAAPQVMVLDNEKAEIKVGDRISVQTQSQTVSGTSSGTIANSYQYLETGVLLAVTPRINSGGMVTLEINQEVSQADPTSVTNANPNPNVATRNAKTSVQVGSGESIVLGGLIRETNGRATSGLPLLSKIPVLGSLFGTQKFTRDRTELVLVVTPRIVSDPNQAREVTEELRSKLPALKGLLPKPPAAPAPVNPAPVLK